MIQKLFPKRVERDQVLGQMFHYAGMDTIAKTFADLLQNNNTNTPYIGLCRLTNKSHFVILDI
jgi:hypothetical protein